MTKLYTRDRYRVADTQVLDLPTPLSNLTVVHEYLEGHMEDKCMLNVFTLVK